MTSVKCFKCPWDILTTNFQDKIAIQCGKQTEAMLDYLRSLDNNNPDKARIILVVNNSKLSSIIRPDSITPTPIQSLPLHLDMQLLKVGVSFGDDQNETNQMLNALPAPKITVVYPRIRREDNPTRQIEADFGLLRRQINQITNQVAQLNTIVLQQAQGDITDNSTSENDPNVNLLTSVDFDSRIISVPTFEIGSDIEESLLTLETLCRLCPTKTRTLILNYLTTNHTLASDLVSLSSEQLSTIQAFKAEMLRRHQKTSQMHYLEFEQMRQKPEEKFSEYKSRLERKWCRFRGLSSTQQLSPTCKQFLKQKFCRTLTDRRVRLLLYQNGVEFDTIDEKAHIYEESFLLEKQANSLVSDQN